MTPKTIDADADPKTSPTTTQEGSCNPSTNEGTGTEDPATGTKAGTDLPMPEGKKETHPLTA